MKITSLLCLASLFLTLPLAAAETKKMALNEADAKFVKKAAHGGMAEVKMGELALKKAERPEVKAFAQRMVHDHGNANTKLEALAEAKGVTLSHDMDSSTSKTYAMLEKESGAEFDKAYVKAMLKDHKMDVAEFESKEKEVSDTELKAWVSSTLPTLRSHLDAVKGLQK